jgi:hypothetical protein
MFIRDWFNLRPRTLGRSFDEDPEFFEAAAAAGIVGIEMITAGE